MAKKGLGAEEEQESRGESMEETRRMQAAWAQTPAQPPFGSAITPGS